MIPNISVSTVPNFTSFSALIGVCMQIMKLKYFLQHLKRRCCGNRLTFEPFCRCQNWPSSLFLLAFPNKCVNAQINNYPDVSILYEILVKIGTVTSEFKRAKFENLPRLGCNVTIIVHLARWKRIGILQFSFQQVNRQSFLYILWKSGEILISDPRVLSKRSCTSGVDNCYHA